MLAAVALAVTAAGCGGGSGAKKGDCTGNLVDTASARVVAKFYARGRLSRSVLERALGPRGRTFFDAKGRLRPYSSLNARERSDFNDMMFANAAVGKVIAKEQAAAVDAARIAAKTRC